MDAVLSAVALAALLVPFALIAVAIKCSSRGPVFYRQQRVGKNQALFTMWKFRSMVANADSAGPQITAAGDRRVTPVGRILRRWKLDELPQLWNVLRGDMSLVGPRPEVPRYVEHYSAAQRQVFSVLPGITDPASLDYRNEEALLAAASDRESFYRETLLPKKLARSLEYIPVMSFTGDVALILATLGVLPSRLTPVAGQGSHSGRDIPSF